MSETDTFLAALFDEKPDTSFVSIFTLPGEESKHTRSVQAAAAYAAMMAPNHDVYVGVGLRGKDHGTGQRGKFDDVIGLVGFWADVDIAGPGHDKSGAVYPPDVDAARALVEGMPLRPTLLVHSGHGLQPWWLFTEPYVFDDAADRQRTATQAARWLALLQQRGTAHGWRVDSVADITRVLRVPGTMNRKVAADVVPVRLLTTGGPVYAGPSDFDDYGIDPPSATRLASAISMDGLTFDPTATPPFDKWQALLDQEPLFKASWERKRKDKNIKDTTGSGYDLSLASFTVSYGWSDQEIVDLLIAAARKHGDQPKEPRYYARTIGKARADKDQEAAISQLASMSDDPSGDEQATREQALNLLSRAIGVDVAGVIQHGRERSRYSLRLTDGREIAIGGVSSLLNANEFRAKVLEATTHAIPYAKPAYWIDVAGRLCKVAELVENTDASRQSTLVSWLRAYLRDTTQLASDDAHMEAAAQDQPFIKDGMVHIHAEELRRFVILHAFERIESPDVHDMLRAAGFTRKEVYVRHGGKRTRRSYWWAPQSVLGDEPDEGATVNSNNRGSVSTHA